MQSGLQAAYAQISGLSVLWGWKDLCRDDIVGIVGDESRCRKERYPSPFIQCIAYVHGRH